LRSFSGGNFDGANPSCDLTYQATGFLARRHMAAGSGYGTVFTLTTNGGGGVVHYFTNGDGSYPKAGLVLIGNTLYGTTAYGGDYGYGTVFAVNAMAPSLRTCTVSPAVTTELILPQIWCRPATPCMGRPARVLLAVATIFAVNTDGMGFTNLYSFTATDLNTGTNSDGAGPEELTYPAIPCMARQAGAAFGAMGRSSS